MYVMEGMGATLPVTNEMAHALAVARMRNLRREADQSYLGFGQVNFSPDLIRQAVRRTSPTVFRTFFPGAVGDFLDVWGIPIGAGLGGLALGLVMAKTLKRKKKG